MPDAKGQFSIVNSPQALPGHCAGCGKPNDPHGFIDTGFDADFHGVIYYCSECIFDMASKFGYITPEMADQFKRQISELEVESAKQRAAILGLEETIDGLLAVRESGASNIVIPAPSEPINEPRAEDIITETESEPESVVEVTDSETAGGNSEVDKPDIEPIPVGVSSDSGYEFADLDF